MRSKGVVPDISLDQLDGVIRKQVLRQVDRMMFDHQAQSREERKWRGFREPEDENLLKRPKRKVRFNPCSTQARKRTVGSSVDELARQVDVSIICSASSPLDGLTFPFQRFRLW